VQPRAIGAAMVSAKASRGRSTLSDLRQSGAMKLLFPRPDGEALQAIVINSAGGITGGDVFALNANAEKNAMLSLTTQAAERAYRAQPGQVASVRNSVTVEPGGTLHWLPQETILYDGCALRRSLCVDLAHDASLLLVEPLVFGRAAMGEALHDANFRDRIEITRAGQPLFLDAMTLHGDVTKHLAAAHIAAGAGALATLIYVAPDAEARLARLRAALPDSAGASLIGPDLLVARILAHDSFDLRQSLVPILRDLSGDTLPRSWMT